MLALERLFVSRSLARRSSCPCSQRFCFFVEPVFIVGYPPLFLSVSPKTWINRPPVVMHPHTRTLNGIQTNTAPATGAFAAGRGSRVPPDQAFPHEGRTMHERGLQVQQGDWRVRGEVHVEGNSARGGRGRGDKGRRGRGRGAGGGRGREARREQTGDGGWRVKK